MKTIAIKSTIGRAWPAHGFEIHPGDNSVPVLHAQHEELLLGFLGAFVEAGQMAVMDGSEASVSLGERIDATVVLDAAAKAKSDSRARAAARDEAAEIAKLDAAALASDAAEAKAKADAEAKANQGQNQGQNQNQRR